MNKKYITISGAPHRVEANWNAITAYLASRGKDSLQGLSDISKLPPSELAPLMAACLNEGERLDGHDASFTAEWIGENCGMNEVSDFVAAFCEQSLSKMPSADAEKKD